jgi:hypothetical protein
MALTTRNRLALEQILEACPEWRHNLRSSNAAFEDPFRPGDLYLEVACPENGPNHCLSIRCTDNTIEVAYADGRPPGPTERQFIAPSDAEFTAALAEALDFIHELSSGKRRASAWVRSPHRPPPGG